jgi:hypothetical protein
LECGFWVFWACSLPVARKQWVLAWRGIGKGSNCRYRSAYLKELDDEDLAVVEEEEVERTPLLESTGMISPLIE